MIKGINTRQAKKLIKACEAIQKELTIIDDNDTWDNYPLDCILESVKNGVEAILYSFKVEA